MKKSILSTNTAPGAIGPYSQAVAAGGMLYISGQIAINPENGKIEAEDLKGQTEQVMKNLQAVLNFADLNFKNVVKSTIFLAPDQDFATVNAIYGARFTGNYPARETVWVNALPKNVLVEISMIAVV
ncbi:MAG TPA: RidA family protein [Bacteroidetes bacterium]|nr:RidA family protein [Bacteroidota bacterium]